MLLRPVSSQELAHRQNEEGFCAPAQLPRRTDRGSSTASAAIGWIAALLLHGGLLLAVLLQQPFQLLPIPSRAAVSLILQPPGQQQTVAVAPRPPEPAARPLLPPSIIANAPTSRSRLFLPRSPSRSAARPAPAEPPTAMPRDSTGQKSPPAPQGFAAAAPLGNNANPPPEYPQAAIDHGEQGKVLLSVHVLPNGLADFVSVSQSSGFRVLDQAAQAAVLKWRFRPAHMAGQPVVMVLPFWINFDLDTQTAKSGQ